MGAAAAAVGGKLNNEPAPVNGLDDGRAGGDGYIGTRRLLRSAAAAAAEVAALARYGWYLR